MAVERGSRKLAVLGALAALLLPSPGAAYTIKETDNGAVIRWHEPNVRLRIDPSLEQYFDEIPIWAVVNEAASAWRDVEGTPELLINAGEPGARGYDSHHGESNGIYLIEHWELDESSLAVTVATYESKSGRMVDTDILVNANHPFALLPNGPDARAEAYDLRGVLTHEMGHVLGLGESYGVRPATMFPSIARGETHQRDLYVDDEEGAEDAYAGAQLSEIKPTGGCSGASVIVRRGQSAPAWAALLVSAALLSLAWKWSRGRKLTRETSAPMLAFALLFAAPYESGPNSENERVEVIRTLAIRRLPPEERSAALARAANSDSANVRMTAAALLERVGTREDRSLAARLSRDADPEVRRVAHQALQRLHSAPPTTRIAREAPEAVQRLAHLLGNADTVVAGEAVRTGTHLRNGLIWSRFLVHGQSADQEVEIPGGTLGELTQVFSEQEPPSDGDTLLVAVQAAGPHRWAHVRDGVLYGGWLGEGPGIDWN